MTTPLPDLEPAALEAAIDPRRNQMTEKFIELTDDGDKMTCSMPADETVVEVRLKDGSVVRAWYSCNIMEAGDFDFLPIDDDDGEPKFDADSIADQVAAWRPAVLP